MVYQQKFVAVVKVNGKILRELEDNLVYLPFGSEYEILLKNLDSRPAVVKISIDGKDVLDGNEIVISPNSDFSLDGFIKNNRTTNKFKFIQKTKEISDHRGDRVDDGMIRIEWKFTKQVEEVITRERKITSHEHVYHHRGCNCPWCRPIWWYHPPYTYNPIIGSSINDVKYGCSSRNVSSSVSSSNTNQATTFTASADNSVNSGQSVAMASVPTINTMQVNSNNINNILRSNNPFIPDLDIKQDEGITVKGSKSNQHFNYVQVGELEDNSHVMILRLKGHFKSREDKKPSQFDNMIAKPEMTKMTTTAITKPITVNTKIVCETCGRKSKSNKQYCSNCGTALF